MEPQTQLRGFASEVDPDETDPDIRVPRIEILSPLAPPSDTTIPDNLDTHLRQHLSGIVAQLSGGRIMPDDVDPIAHAGLRSRLPMS
jgi:hypothetical protein